MSDIHDMPAPEDYQPRFPGQKPITLIEGIQPWSVETLQKLVDEGFTEPQIASIGRILKDEPSDCDFHEGEFKVYIVRKKIGGPGWETDFIRIHGANGYIKTYHVTYDEDEKISNVELLIRALAGDGYDSVGF